MLNDSHPGCTDTPQLPEIVSRICFDLILYLSAHAAGSLVHAEIMICISTVKLKFILMHLEC